MRAAPVLAVLVAAALAGCGDDAGDSTTTTTDDDTTETTEVGTGGDRGGDATIAVRLEETEAVLIEGFELGLRFTDAASGEEIERVRWNDLIATLGSTDLDAYYDSVLEQPVPAGTIRIGADLNVGIGPPPEPPDLDAPSMPCELDVDVAAGETITVEVRFDDAAPDCLRIVDG